MARIRTIKPEFWTDSKTGTLSGEATKLFIGMLNFADDYGVLEYDLAALKAKIYPYDKKDPDELVGKVMMEELLPKGLVVLFNWDSAKKSYLFIRNFHKHQRIDRPSNPLLKGFNSKHIQDFIDGIDEDATSTQRAVSEYSTREGKGKEGKGKEGNGEDRKDHKKTIKTCANAQSLSDEDFLKALKTKPVYNGIDIDRELEKMDTWLMTRPDRKKTRRFIINWLNKIDKPVASQVKVKPRPRPDCSVCGGTGKIQDGAQKGAKCFCW